MTTAVARFDGSFTGSNQPTGATKTFLGLEFLGGATPLSKAVTISSSGTFTLNGNSGIGILDTSNQAITINQAITLGNNLTYTTTGATGGSLTIGGGTTLGSHTLELDAGTSAPITISGVIASTTAGNGVIVGGPGKVTLSGTNTYNGVTTINGGTLAVTTLASGNSNSSIGKSSAAASNLIINGGTLQYTGTTNVSSNRSFTIGNSGATIDVAAGAGKLTLSTTSALSFATTNTATTLTLNANNTSGTNTLTGSLTDNGTAKSSLVVSGSGTWALNGTSNTYSGDTQIQSGTLQAGNSNRLSANSQYVVSSGATLDLNSKNNAIGSLSGSGAVTLGTATLTTGGDNKSSTFSGNITGTGGLAKAGTGTFTLTGSNSYSGTTTVTDGTLQLGSANAVPNGNALAIDASANGKLDLNGYDLSVTTLTSTNTSGGGGGEVALGSGTLTVGSTNASSTYYGSLTGAGNLTKSGTGTLTLNGTGTYSGQTLINSGTIKLGSATALQGNSAVVLSDTTTSTLNLNSNNATIGSLAGGAGGGTVSLGTGTLTTGGNNTSTAYTGVISGTGGLTKVGTGTLTLSGSSTFTGTTQIQGGTLSVNTITNANSSSALGKNATIAIGSGTNSGTLQYTGATTSTNRTVDLAGTTGGGTIEVAGTGSLTFTSNFTASGSGAKTLTLAGNTSGVGTINGAIVDSSGGATSLTKTGSGTWVLGGANTYTGATTVNGGTLQMGAANAISSSSAVVLANASGATLDLNGNNQTVGSLAGGGASGGNVTLGSATLTAGGDNTSTTYSGAISGTGGLTKAGTGTLTLAGTNTYTGATTINAGTLQAGSANTLSSSSAITLANVSGAKLDLNGNSQTVASIAGGGTSGGNITLGSGTLTTGGNNSSTTYSGAISGTGGLTKTGTGTLTLTGTNTYTGATTINNGTLAVGANNALGTSPLPNITVNATSAGTTATFAVNNSVSQSIGSLTFGGTGATSTSTNNATIGSSGTLTLGGNVTYNATNNPLGSTISGAGTLALGSSTRTFNVGDSSNAANDLTISSNISGTGQSSGGLTKTGNGTLQITGTATYDGSLNNTNSFNGVVNVNAGTLLATNTSTSDDVGGFALLGNHGWVTSPTTVITVADGATLAVNSGATVFDGSKTSTHQYETLSLSGTGYNGAGALNSTGGNNTWLGNISLAGNTTITNSAAAGDSNLLFLGAPSEFVSPFTPPPTSFALNNHTLTFNGSGDTFISSTIGNSGGDTGSVVLNMSSAASTVYFGGTQNFYTGSTTVNQGTLTLDVDPGNHPNSAILGSLTIGDGSGGADTAIVRGGFSDQIADNASVTINSDGQLDLGTYGPSETIGALTLSGGHVLLNGANSGNLYLGDTVHVTGGLTSTIDGDAATGGINLNSSDTGIAASQRTFNVDTGSTLQVNARINDRGTGTNGGFVKDGGGTMVVTSDNTYGYSGITEVKNGILNIQDNHALGQIGSESNGTAADSGTVVDSGGTLQLDNTRGNLTVAAERLQLNGSGYGGIGALDNKTGDNQWTGKVTLGSDATVKSDSGTLTLSGDVTIDSSATNAAHTMTVGGAGNTTISSRISDGTLSNQVFNIDKVDSGTLTLSGPDTLSGTIAVNAGTVNVNASGVLGKEYHTIYNQTVDTSVSVASGATFSLTGGTVSQPFSNTIASVTGLGTVSIAGSTTLKVNNSSQDTFGGTLSGSGLFQKAGSGTLTFSSSSNTSAFNFGGTVELASNSTLEFQGGLGTGTTSTNALFINTLQLDTGTLLLTNAYINVGTLIITGDTILDFGTSGASILNASNIYIAAGATLTVKDWTSEVDFLFATNSSYATSGGFRLTNSSGTLAIFNAIGSAPEDQVQFQGNSLSSDGSHTTWINSGYGGYTNWEIRPIPEPSTYGAFLLGGCLALLGWRRYRRNRRAARC